MSRQAKKKMSGVATRIRTVRVLAGMKQADFARLVGVTEGQIGTWERADAEPSLEHLVEILRRFGISGHWLLTGQGPVASAEIGPVQRDAATGIAEPEAMAVLGELPDEEIERLAKVGRSALVEDARTMQLREPPVQRDGYVEEVVREYEVRPTKQGKVAAKKRRRLS